MKRKRIYGICVSVILAVLTGCAVKTTEQEKTEKKTSDSRETNIVLDYAQGIADGVYGWTLSEDGSYYMLSAIDKDGIPIESTAQQNFKQLQNYRRGESARQSEQDSQRKDRGARYIVP